MRTLATASASVLVLSALFLTSCSSGEPANNTARTAGTVSSEVQTAVDQDRKLPDEKVSADPIDPKSLKGKKVFEIPLAPNPFLQSISDSMKEVADEFGIHYTVFANQGEVSQWVQGMDQAISAKSDVIILNGAPDPRALQPQIQAAKNAGIPVVVSHFHDNSSPEPPNCEGCASGVSALVTAPFYAAGEAAAKWIIADSGGSANTLIVGGSDIVPSPGTIDAMNATFSKYCSSCKSKVINIPVADWNTKTQGEVQSALQANPNINYVYVLYDAMVAGAVPAVETLGKSDSVKIASYNGSPFALDDIRQNSSVVMNVGEDTIGIGYATMDQAFRLMLGKPAIKTSTPIRVWDRTNISEAGEPAKSGIGYGDGYKNQYRKLWGLQ